MRGLTLVLVSVFFFCGISFANYPYESVCPKGPDGNVGGEDIDSFVNWVCTDSGCFYKDRWGFAQCNCTSYAAFRLNEVAPIGFNNGYKGAEWHSGGQWGSAANSAGISVDKNPLPGDVAYWSPTSENSYGHVAFVENVNYDEQGK